MRKRIIKIENIGKGEGISTVKQKRLVSNFINLAPYEQNIPTSREITSYVPNVWCSIWLRERFQREKLTLARKPVLTVPKYNFPVDFAFHHGRYQ